MREAIVMLFEESQGGVCYEASEGARWLLVVSVAWWLVCGDVVDQPGSC